MIECDMCAGKTIEKKGITNSQPTYNLQAEHRKEINAMSPFPLRDHFASCGRAKSELTHQKDVTKFKPCHPSIHPFGLKMNISWPSFWPTGLPGVDTCA